MENDFILQILFRKFCSLQEMKKNGEKKKDLNYFIKTYDGEIGRLTPFGPSTQPFGAQLLSRCNAVGWKERACAMVFFFATVLMVRFAFLTGAFFATIELDVEYKRGMGRDGQYWV